MKTAIIVGSSGLTGAHLLDLLLESETYSRVVSLVRTRTNKINSKLVEHIVDFDDLKSIKHLIIGDDFFCCLGTTIKKAGSQEAFEKVDLIYPTEFARIAYDNGVAQFSIITAIGSSSKSSNFYLRTKGRCEDKIKTLPFSATRIFRPSLLVGDRGEFRMGEKVSAWTMRFLNLFMFGKLRKYRSIKAATVAKAMLTATQLDKHGLLVYESDKIENLSK